MRAAAIIAVLLGAATAQAQPVDPYGPAPAGSGSATAAGSAAGPGSAAPPAAGSSIWDAPGSNAPAPAAPGPATPAPGPRASTPPGGSAGLPEQIAESLVERAQELLDDKAFADAKQLAVEALVQSPDGPAGAHAKAIIKSADIGLGVTEPAPPVKQQVAPPPDLRPIQDPTKVDQPTPAAEPKHSPRVSSIVDGALYGATLGATIGSFFSHNEAAGAVPTALALGAVGGVLSPYLAKHVHASEAQARTLGAGILWGGVFGGLVSGTAEGANGGAVSGRAVLVGSLVGATIGGFGGLGLAWHDKLTRGDVALVDTFAGIGTLGGLTLGLLMQPAQGEAYSLNAAIGAAAGVVVGMIAAPRTNTTPRRMLRVAGIVAIGGAWPFIIWAADPHSTGAARATGALSTLGMIGGAWLGFYLTRHIDVGLDVPDGQAAPVADAPPAIVGRNSDGHWALGGIGLAPLSPQLSTDPGAAVSLVAGKF